MIHWSVESYLLTPHVSDCRAHQTRQHTYSKCAGRSRKGYAQLEPTALSVLAMLLPAVCTFCPWMLACS